jgi:hypothetical protein
MEHCMILQPLIINYLTVSEKQNITTTLIIRHLIFQPF